MSNFFRSALIGFMFIVSNGIAGVTWTNQLTPTEYYEQSKKALLEFYGLDSTASPVVDDENWAIFSRHFSGKGDDRKCMISLYGDSNIEFLVRVKTKELDEPVIPIFDSRPSDSHMQLLENQLLPLVKRFCNEVPRYFLFSYVFYDLVPPKGGLVSQRYELDNDILKFPDSTPKLPPDAKRSLSKSQNLHLGFSTLYGGVDLSANPKTAHMAPKPRMNEAWQITEEEILQMQIKTLDPECLSQAEDRIAYCMGTSNCTSASCESSAFCQTKFESAWPGKPGSPGIRGSRYLAAKYTTGPLQPRCGAASSEVSVF